VKSGDCHLLPALPGWHSPSADPADPQPPRTCPVAAPPPVCLL